METYISESASDTARLGVELVPRLNLVQGSTLTRPVVIALYGDLGSGKTTFVQGLAKGLAIKNRIISPTFVLIRRYEAPPTSRSGFLLLLALRDILAFIPALTSGVLRSQNKVGSKYKVSSIKYFYHIDLYRIESRSDIDGLGLEEILNDPQNVVAIEWAEKLGTLLPKQRIDVWFEYVDEEKRKITINGSG